MNNADKIEKAFAEMARKGRARVNRGIKEGTKAGYDFAIDIHEKSEHELHLILGGDFGRAVVEDGKVTDFKVVTGKTSLLRGAEKRLGQQVNEVPSGGTMGVVTAGMQPKVFDNHWEESVLKAASKVARQVAENVIGK